MEQPRIVHSIEIILTAIALTLTLGITGVISDAPSASLSGPIPHSNARW